MKVIKITATSNRTSFPGCCIIKQLTGLSQDVLEKLQLKASKESKASKEARKKDPNSKPTNEGPIYIKTFYSKKELKLLKEQLDYYGLIYDIDKSGRIYIIGAKDKQGNVIAKAKTPNLLEENPPHLPKNGTWDSKEGNGRFMPDENESPLGHPVNIPYDLDNPYISDEKKKEYKEYLDEHPDERKKILDGIQKRKNNNATIQKKRNDDPEKNQPKDLGLKLYDEDGNPIRYPWGTPGQQIDYTPGNPPTISPATIISQVEYYVNEHRKRHGLPDNYVFKGVEYVDNEPVMDEFSMGTVEMEFFSSDRDVNFLNADELMAEQLNAQGKTIIDAKTKLPRPLTADDVKKYREQNDLTWHEDPSCSKMIKVPTILHANVPHDGGVSKTKTEGQNKFLKRDKILEAEIKENAANQEAIEAKKTLKNTKNANGSDADVQQAEANVQVAETNAQEKSKNAEEVRNRAAERREKKDTILTDNTGGADANANIRVNNQSPTSGKATKDDERPDETDD